MISIHMNRSNFDDADRVATATHSDGKVQNFIAVFSRGWSRVPSFSIQVSLKYYSCSIPISFCLPCVVSFQEKACQNLLLRSSYYTVDPDKQLCTPRRTHAISFCSFLYVTCATLISSYVCLNCSYSSSLPHSLLLLAARYF